MDSTIYNYTIIGAGCAGIHLALAMMEDSYFDDKQILVLDKDAKEVNDRTWCFWEAGTGKWDSILHHSWSRGNFHTTDFSCPLEMQPYHYKMLRSIEFYKHGLSRIQKADNFHWVQDDVSEIKEDQVIGSKGSYQSRHIFDSRIPVDFHEQTDKHTRILQHFKGWVIKTEKPVFNPDEFVMMDFRMNWNNHTSFTYVLPTSKTSALIEFTLFDSSLLKKEDYDTMLEKYIKEYLELDTYSIEEVEFGVIPMSDFPFHHYNKSNLTKIGTAGGWVKPSSGYSFKNSERCAAQIVNNIKSGKPINQGVIKHRFRNYDKLLLDILKNKNELGKRIFSTMFTKNPARQIFKFLDEETSLIEDIKIISSFDSKPFLKALYNQLF